MRGRVTEFMLAYTSSGPWRGGVAALPVGIIMFGAAEARRLNQIPFHLDLRCLARVPPSADWFPAWAEAGRGVVAVADAALQRRILREAELLMQASPEIVETRGIGADTTTRIKRRLP
jgi:hypothetical protein